MLQIEWHHIGMGTLVKMGHKLHCLKLQILQKEAESVLRTFIHESSRFPRNVI